jgi:hypothetical protein
MLTIQGRRCKFPGYELIEIIGAIVPVHVDRRWLPKRRLHSDEGVYNATLVI